jgi:thymidylate synthase (FAD)
MSKAEEALERIRSEALERLLGKKFPVLDDGFVRVLDYMGTDDSIVQAARVSYGKGTKQVREDRALIRYLMRNRHTSPFEMCEIKLHLRMPMDCWRQWVRHRTASINEYSTRYSIAIDSAQRTPPTNWRKQSTTNKQGSGEQLEFDQGTALSTKEQELINHSRAVYEERLELGVAREQARKDLPLSTYTEAYWKIDLHNLLHFLSLRMSPHAQEEIRSYATIIGEQIVSTWCPEAWDAFKTYRLNAITLSEIEISIISNIAQGRNEEAVAQAQSLGLLDAAGQPTARSREREEIEQKLKHLGLPVVWRSANWNENSQ